MPAAISGFHRIIFIAFTAIIFLACQKNTIPVNSDGLPAPALDKAVMIHSSSGVVGPCEPSICINPKDPDNIIAGSVLDNVYVSNDGGYSWQVDKLHSSYGVYGDPVVRADNKGSIYYAHLSNPNGKAYQDEAFLDRIVIQKSTDKGKQWSDGSYTLPRSPKDQDKHWLAIHPDNHTVYITWTEFDLYGSDNPEHKSRILFSKSVDEGENWTDPVVLSQHEGNCLDDDQTTEGAVPSVGPNGELYVAWSYDEKLYFDRSTDDGKTWLEKDIVIGDHPGGWGFEVPGITRCNGMPVTAVDLSGGPNHGTIYVNWSDQRNGKENTDIWLSYSTDKGNTWSAPIRVNQDKSERHQFFTWMDIDQSTGFIYLVYYDRRHHDDTTTDVFLAWSTDGGKSFDEMKINASSFVPNPFVFFGDYNDISVHQGKVRPIWTQSENNVLSVWTAILQH